MNLRRLLIPLLGAWIGVISLLMVQGVQSTEHAERTLDRPHERAGKIFEAVGPRAAGQLVRYEAAELVIRHRAFWLRVEIAIGIAVFLGLLFGTDAGTGPLVLALLMVVAVLAQMFGVYPFLMGLVRALAFDVRDATLEKDYLFLNGVFLCTEGLKILLGIGVILSIGSRRRRQKQFREEIHPVHNPDHSHVNR
ncbi:MAG: hypothetical protein NTY38_18815 [Acidobacteria bacterium]|nr:hypothetical protein [Acidobacteriota bacterium]